MSFSFCLKKRALRRVGIVLAFLDCGLPFEMFSFVDTSLSVDAWLSFVRSFLEGLLVVRGEEGFLFISENETGQDEQEEKRRKVGRAMVKVAVTRQPLDTQNVYGHLSCKTILKEFFLKMNFFKKKKIFEFGVI